MAQPHASVQADRRTEALTWLVEELAWETRLDRLRRPGRQPRPATIAARPEPVAGLRRAS
jgi:hypothetical protein